MLKAFGDSDVEPLCNRFNASFIQGATDLQYQGHGSSTVFTTCEERCRNSAYLPHMLEEDLKIVIKSMSMAKPSGHNRIRLRDIVVHLKKQKHL